MGNKCQFGRRKQAHRDLDLEHLKGQSAMAMRSRVAEILRVIADNQQKEFVSRSCIPPRRVEFGLNHNK